MLKDILALKVKYSISSLESPSSTPLILMIIYVNVGGLVSSAPWCLYVDIDVL